MPMKQAATAADLCTRQVVVCQIPCSFSRTAAALLVPYLAWVSFAGALNWLVVDLNGPFGWSPGQRRRRRR